VTKRGVSHIPIPEQKRADGRDFAKQKMRERAKLESPATTEAPARCDTLITAPEKINTRRRRQAIYRGSVRKK
jgi:hypothetical protein